MTNAGKRASALLGPAPIAKVTFSYECPDGTTLNSSWGRVPKYKAEYCAVKLIQTLNP